MGWFKRFKLKRGREKFINDYKWWCYNNFPILLNNPEYAEEMEEKYEATLSKFDEAINDDFFESET